MAVRKRSAYANRDELFAAVRARCEEEYERDFGHVWAGIDDWPQFKRVTPFEQRARDTYDKLAKAVEESRALIEEWEGAQLEWRDFASTLDSAALGKAAPPDAATSTTAMHLARWVRGADREAARHAAAGGDPRLVGVVSDIARRPWMDNSAPDTRLLVTLHVLGRAHFTVVPMGEDGSDDRVGIAAVEIATDRQAAIMSLLQGERPSSATPKWTVSRVILHEAAAMRLSVRRTFQRFVDTVYKMIDGFERDGVIASPHTLEDAMLWSIAFSKQSEIGASAIRLSEQQHPEETRRVREADPGFEKLLAAAAVLDPKRHKHRG